MPRQRTEFTNKSVIYARPGRHHAGVTGLYLFVSPDAQVRRWIFRFTSPVTGRVTEAGLGMVAEVPLADARTKADALRRQVATGVCPIQARRDMRAERAARITFREAADQWMETHKSAWKNGDASAVMRTAKNLLHRHGRPLAKIAVGEVTPDDVQKALQPLWDKSPGQARAALSMWGRVFDYAKAHNMRTGDNPCDWKSCHQYRFPKRRKEERGHYEAMPYEQMPSFLRDLRKNQNRSTAAIALEFTILTACRSCEVLSMAWAEVDLDQCLWTIPGERMKTGKEHRVPLSDATVAILKRQKQFSNDSPFVFSGYKLSAMSNRSMAWMLRQMGIKGTVHGMRSTFRDWAGDMTDYARETIEECLAHQVGNSVERAYRRRNALEKRRAIMDEWAKYCG